MALDLPIQALLRSTPVQSIDFQLGRVRVTPLGYMEVSSCFSEQIMRGRIRVIVDPAQVPRRALAAYNSDNNKLYLKGLDVLATMRGRAQVVHECTHAQCDIRRTQLWIPLEEAACFLAEAFYYLAHNVNPRTQDPDFPDAFTGMAIRMRGQAGTRQQRALDEEVRVAERVMTQQWQYPAGSYVSDGIPGRRIRD